MVETILSAVPIQATEQQVTQALRRLSGQGITLPSVMKAFKVTSMKALLQAINKAHSKGSLWAIGQ